MMIPSLVDGAVTVNPVVLTSVSTHAPEIVSIVVAVGKSGTGTVAVGATVETSGGAATRGGSSPNIILQVLLPIFDVASPPLLPTSPITHDDNFIVWLPLMLWLSPRPM